MKQATEAVFGANNYLHLKNSKSRVPQAKHKSSYTARNNYTMYWTTQRQAQEGCKELIEKFLPPEEPTELECFNMWADLVHAYNVREINATSFYDSLLCVQCMEVYEFSIEKQSTFECEICGCCDVLACNIDEDDYIRHKHYILLEAA